MWEHDGGVAQVPGVAQHLVHHTLGPAGRAMGWLVALGSRPHASLVCPAHSPYGRSVQTSLPMQGCHQVWQQGRKGRVLSCGASTLLQMR